MRATCVVVTLRPHLHAPLQAAHLHPGRLHAARLAAKVPHHKGKTARLAVAAPPHAKHSRRVKVTALHRARHLAHQARQAVGAARRQLLRAGLLPPEGPCACQPLRQQLQAGGAQRLQVVSLRQLQRRQQLRGGSRGRGVCGVVQGGGQRLRAMQAAEAGVACM